MKTSTSNQLRWLWLSVAVILVDQWAKWWVSTHLTIYQSFSLLPVLNITLQHNLGAAFGFLHDKPGWQRWFFATIAVIVSIIILRTLAKTPRRENWFACALALVLGGALGNLYDRLVFTYVVDFIDFHINTWHFATFNLADSAITIGVIMWLISACFFTSANTEKTL